MQKYYTVMPGIQNFLAGDGDYTPGGYTRKFFEPPARRGGPSVHTCLFVRPRCCSCCNSPNSGLVVEWSKAHVSCVLPPGYQGFEPWFHLELESDWKLTRRDFPLGWHVNHVAFFWAPDLITGSYSTAGRARKLCDGSF